MPPTSVLFNAIEKRKRQNAATLGNKTDSEPKTKPKHTTSHCRRKPDSSALSENLQPNSATRSNQHSDCRSIQTAEDHIQGNSDMSRPPYTALRARILARADCTLDAQTSTAQSSPHCAHLPPRKRTCRPQCLRRFLPSHRRQMQMSPNFWLHQSLVTDGTLLPCSRLSKAFASAALGLFRWIAQKSNLTWDLV